MKEYHSGSNIPAGDNDAGSTGGTAGFLMRFLFGFETGSVTGTVGTGGFGMGNDTTGGRTMACRDGKD